jgi:GT2 family glycosyltransferase
MAHHSLTVIIPTLERPRVTKATLRSLEAQTVSDFVVIVLDQTKPVPRILADYHSGTYEYVYHNIDELGSGNARNVAAELAQSDLLLYLDDDIVPDENMIANYLKLFSHADETTWVIGGKTIEEGSRVLSERKDIYGGYVTKYGKTLKNFHSDLQGECEWVGSGNCCVRRERFLQVGGFDTSFIGNAILEDPDFCFRIRMMGGTVLYSPLPMVQHLRAMEGGTRRFRKDAGMYYRSHNTVYFFRRHMPTWSLPLTLLYLHGVALKDLVRRKHSPLAIFYMWIGFLKGLRTPGAILGSQKQG